jgi:hypothetical protein
VQKFLSKFSVAFHLALLSVAPLFVYDKFGSESTAVVLLWLSLISSIFILVEPSRRKGETLSVSRRRVLQAILKDPVFWVFLVVASIAAIRYFNDGVALAFNAEDMKWHISSPAVEYLPGSVTGAGLLPFSIVVAAMVVALGCSHALGRAARIHYLVFSCVLAAIVAIVKLASLAQGDSWAVAAANATLLQSSYSGTGFGIFMLAGVSAFIGIFELRWNVLLLFLAIGIGTCMTGLFVFSPIHVLLLFVIAFLIMVICSVTYAGRYCDRSIVFKFLSGIVMAFFIPVISVLWMSSNEIVTSRIAPFADLENFKLFPEKYWKVREICSSIALKVWNKEHWLGTGIGSFAIDIPFHAKPVDWIVLKEGYNTAINGWWQILAECGLIGILSILLVFGGMLFSFLRRFILSLGIISYYPAAALGIISSTVVLSQGFFDLTFLRPEVIVPIVALFSIGTGSFISASNNRTDVKNASDNG